MVDGIEADAKKTLTGPAGHSPVPVNLYCATSPPPEVGQLDRGGDELTKAGNARGITGEPPPHLPDDAGDADAGIFSPPAAFLSPPPP